VLDRPDAGDLVWLTFDPHAGHKQRGRRRAKGYPFEVELPAAGTISGVVLADHVKNLDWEARRAVFEAKAPAEVLTEVRERLRALIEL
jgi:mRNA interferase MazF